LVVRRSSFVGRGSVVGRGFANDQRLILAAKTKLVPLHIDAGAAEGDSLHAQAEFLFGGAFSGQLDGAARANYPVPGQSGNLAQDAHHLASSSRPARGFRYGAVTGDGSRRQGTNATQDAGALVFVPIPIPIPISIFAFVFAAVTILVLRFISRHGFRGLSAGIR